MIGPIPGTVINCPQLTSAACQVFDLIRYPFDARIEMFPVLDNVSDNPDHTGR